MDRDQLITRKGEVQIKLAWVQRELARVRAGQALPGPAGRRNSRRAQELEAELDALMAEEHRLRLLIDRSG